MKALIADDEPHARERLRRKLAAGDGIAVVGEAANGLEALQRIEELSPDVVFLDIEMPELDGIGVARSLGLAGPRIVFVTAYDEFALKAFEANAIDYLVKPVSDRRLEQTISRLRRFLSPPRPSLESLGTSRVAVKSGKRYVVVDPRHVSALLSRDHYTAILVDGKELLAEESLDRVAQKFRGAHLLRVHRSALINLEALAELVHQGDRKYVAVLKDAARTTVPVSRERLDELKRAVGLGEEGGV